MELTQFNDVFGKLFTIRDRYPLVESTRPPGISIAGYWEIYNVGTADDPIFIRLTYHEDSYGDNERITGIQFVQAKQKTITTYEQF